MGPQTGTGLIDLLATPNPSSNRRSIFQQQKFEKARSIITEEFEDIKEVPTPSEVVWESSNNDYVTSGSKKVFDGIAKSIQRDTKQHLRSEQAANFKQRQKELEIRRHDNR